MPSRPDMTVVIRANGLLARADASGGGEPQIKLWRKDWPDLAAAVTDALKAGGPAGKQVWVLDSGVWLGVVELAAGAVAGLSDQALVEPAAYEAEAMSGLKPVEAVTEVQRRRMADLEDEFLVAQARRADVLAVAKAVRGAGGRLAGLGNPAGLPEVLVSDEATAAAARDGGWRRVCFWSDSVVLVESVAGRVTLLPLGIPPHSDWRTVLAPLLNRGDPVALEQTLIEPGVQVRGGLGWRDSPPGSGSARWLQAGEDSAPDNDGVVVWDLADDAAATAFATAWAWRLAQTEPSRNDIMPTLRPPKAPPGPWPAVAVGVVALALAVTVVLYQRTQQAERLTMLQHQFEHAQGDQRLVNERRKKVKRAEAEVRSERKAVETLERQLERLGRQRAASDAGLIDHREALAALIAALSGTAADDVVIQSIENGSPRHELIGLALSPEAASRLARDLSGELRYDWAVSPARIEPQPGPERIVWRFSITLEPAVDRVARR